MAQNTAQAEHSRSRSPRRSNAPLRITQAPKANLDAEVLRATGSHANDTLEVRSSTYNPSVQMPYTSEELLYLVEPNRSTVKGSSITGDDMNDTPINNLISVQGNPDSINDTSTNVQRNLYD